MSAKEASIGSDRKLIKTVTKDWWHFLGWDPEWSKEIYEKPPSLHYFVFCYDFLLPKMVKMAEAREWFTWNLHWNTWTTGKYKGGKWCDETWIKKKKQSNVL